jgi:hypothetical protein
MVLKPAELIEGTDVELARQGAYTGPRCTARSKSRMRAFPDDPSKHRCSNVAAKGFRVCRFHGAKTPVRGNGRHSAGPVSFKEHYLSALKDDSLLDLREPLAILDSLVKQAAQRIEDKDTPGFRKRAAELMETVVNSHKAMEKSDAASAFRELADLLRTGAADDDARRELREAAESFHDRLVAAWKVRLAAGNVMNYRDTVAMLARVIDILAQECDGQTVVRVCARFQAEISGDLMIRESRDVGEFDGATDARDADGA